MSDPHDWEWCTQVDVCPSWWLYNRVASACLLRPVADLNLSVRARKCMIRLGVSTVGELIRHTIDELLECKYFGVTSLNDVRDKLASHGLKLHADPWQPPS